MASVLQRVPTYAAALWWGSLTAIGSMVVPLLFKYLPTPAMAGQLAAKLFTAQTWMSVCCGMVLLVVIRSERPLAQIQAARSAMIFIVLGLLLALIAEFVVAPRIVARENLALWHGVGSGMYLAQWLCAAILLWKLTASALPLQPAD